MKSKLWNIQGSFVTVGKRELNWVNLKEASVTNDVMINFTEVGFNYPEFQAGFGVLPGDDDPNPIHPSEIGCHEGFYWQDTDMKGQRRSVERTMQLCRQRCEKIEDCTQFSWWRDGGCHMNSIDQIEREIPRHWTQGFSGTMDGGAWPDCGKEHEVKELADKTERDNHGEIWNHCPLLVYIGGVMIDISDIKDEGYLFGNETSAFSVKMEDNRNLYVTYKVGDDDYAVVRLMAEGDGPGEAWSCHWSVWVCIPNIYENSSLEAQTVGLFGSPDGDKSNDWTTPDGTVIGPGDGTAYCYDNWCVSQLDSLMTYPGNTTYEDWKCEEHEYKDYTNNETALEDCIVGHKTIIKKCKDELQFSRYACELDCCISGSCIGSEDPTPPFLRYKTNVSIPEFLIPDHRDCDEEVFEKTANDVCPETAESIIELYHSSDDAPTIDVTDINKMFYGIELNAEIHDDQTGKMVSFKINNEVPGANIFVKHYKSYREHFLDPACDSMLDAVAGCPDVGVDPSPDIEVACHQYDGMTSFATFTVYVESKDIANDEKVDNCCLSEAGEGADRGDYTGSYKYTFKMLCDCPGSNTA
jgi:hypothetical protein